MQFRTTLSVSGGRDPAYCRQKLTFDDLAITRYDAASVHQGTFVSAGLSDFPADIAFLLAVPAPAGAFACIALMGTLSRRGKLGL